MFFHRNVFLILFLQVLFFLWNFFFIGKPLFHENLFFIGKTFFHVEKSSLKIFTSLEQLYLIKNIIFIAYITQCHKPGFFFRSDISVQFFPGDQKCVLLQNLSIFGQKSLYNLSRLDIARAGSIQEHMEEGLSMEERLSMEEGLSMEERLSMEEGLFMEERLSIPKRHPCFVIFRFRIGKLINSRL